VGHAWGSLRLEWRSCRPKSHVAHAYPLLASRVASGQRPAPMHVSTRASVTQGLRDAFVAAHPRMNKP